MSSKFFFFEIPKINYHYTTLWLTGGPNVTLSKIVYVTRENKCFVIRTNGNFREDFSLFSAHKEAEHIVVLDVKFTSSPDKSFCVTSGNTDAFILLFFLQINSEKHGITHNNVK